jgi:hypothetical protein
MLLGRRRLCITLIEGPFIVTTSPTYSSVSYEARVTVIFVYLNSFRENGCIAPTNHGACISSICGQYLGLPADINDVRNVPLIMKLPFFFA